MQFRTELPPSPSDLQIDYQSKLLSFGSCFADRMGERLASAKFNIQVNPLGIAYNPLSLCQLLQIALGEKQLPKAHYSKSEEVWQSLAFHSHFNQKDWGTFEEGVRKALQQTKLRLQEASHLILTFGTATVYRRTDNQEVVNNCHRFPASFFTKELLSVETIESEITETLSLLQTINPQLKVLLTVSPIRHIRDTLPLNSVSKSTLRLACHQLTQSHPNISYFPAFEIMMDDLRDYRYYKEDLLHPTSFAEAYIWGKFVETHLSPAAQETLEIWSQIQKGLSHTPRNPHNEAHRKFLRKLLNKLELISEKIDCEEELREVRGFLEKGDS